MKGAGGYWMLLTDIEGCWWQLEESTGLIEEAISRDWKLIRQCWACSISPRSPSIWSFPHQSIIQVFWFLVDDYLLSCADCGEYTHLIKREKSTGLQELSDRQLNVMAVFSGQSLVSPLSLIVFNQARYTTIDLDSITSIGYDSQSLRRHKRRKLYQVKELLTIMPSNR